MKNSQVKDLFYGMNTQSTTKYFEGEVIREIDAIVNLYKIRWEYKILQHIKVEEDFLYSNEKLKPGDKVRIEDKNARRRIVKKL